MCNWLIDFNFIFKEILIFTLTQQINFYVVRSRTNWAKQRSINRATKEWNSFETNIKENCVLLLFKAKFKKAL